MGNKDKRRGTFLEIAFSSRHVFWQVPLHGNTSFWRQIKTNWKSHGGSLNHWVGYIVHLTVQTHYDIQCLTIELGVYMNPPTEPLFISLRHGMEYLMHHPHELIIYWRNTIFKSNESLQKHFSNSGSAYINKTQEHSNFLYAYFDLYHSRDLTYRRYVTLTAHLFNGIVVVQIQP